MKLHGIEAQTGNLLQPSKRQVQNPCPICDNRIRSSGVAACQYRPVPLRLSQLSNVAGCCRLRRHAPQLAAEQSILGGIESALVIVIVAQRSEIACVRQSQTAPSAKRAAA